MRRQVIFSFEAGPKEQFDGTIERMYSDPDSPLRKHVFGDFDIESYKDRRGEDRLQLGVSATRTLLLSASLLE